MRKIDLTGQRFGRLVVIRECGRDKYGQVLWLCRCDCGNELVVRGYSLRIEETQSCGCLNRERSTKHGLRASHPRLMRSVRNHIKDIRCCTRPCHKNYKHLLIPAKYLGADGVARFVQEVIRRDPVKAEEYERNKNLELDKDISGEPVFAPWSIRFVTREVNKEHRHNTRKINGIPLTKICREEGIFTNSPEYSRIAMMWGTRGVIHPLLWNSRKQNLEKEERLLEITKLKCKRAELLIEGIKKLTTLKPDTLDYPS